MNKKIPLTYCNGDWYAHNDSYFPNGRWFMSEEDRITLGLPGVRGAALFLVSKEPRNGFVKITESRGCDGCIGVLAYIDSTGVEREICVGSPLYVAASSYRPNWIFLESCF